MCFPKHMVRRQDKPVEHAMFSETHSERIVASVKPILELRLAQLSVPHPHVSRVVRIRIVVIFHGGSVRDWIELVNIT